MRSGSRKVLAIIMIVALLASSMTATFAQVSDYQGHWAQQKIEKLIANGIIAGNNGVVRPNDKLSKAELVTILNNLFGYSLKASANFKDVPANAWYADTLLKAKGEGIINGSGNIFKPNDKISRQDAATMIARAFKLTSQTKSYTTFKDGSKVASYAQEAMSALIDKKVLGGSGDGLLRPTSEITRAEVFSMISVLCDQVYNKAGTYENKQFTGNVIVNKPGVTLKNLVIEGDLFLAPGIGQGEVYLDNVKVKGRTVVSGGGENSIHVLNSELSIVEIKRQGGAVRFVAEGTTVISQVLVQSSA
ncbi:MAG: S-layer homology domain-containing protein, partial [Clostridia bacterium]|nr:S-layer homology domain-containing protein [Clostridia bacterium]